jgi:hypothetical protein
MKLPFRFLLFPFKRFRRCSVLSLFKAFFVSQSAVEVEHTRMIAYSFTNLTAFRLLDCVGPLKMLKRSSGVGYTSTHGHK